VLNIKDGLIVRAGFVSSGWPGRCCRFWVGAAQAKVTR